MPDAIYIRDTDSMVDPQACDITFNTVFIYRIFLYSNFDVLPIGIDLIV
jgi:hypothetical protein